jgi:hypothetical protein
VGEGKQIRYYAEEETVSIIRRNLVDAPDGVSYPPHPRPKAARKATCNPSWFFEPEPVLEFWDHLKRGADVKRLL